MQLPNEDMQPIEAGIKLANSFKKRGKLDQALVYAERAAASHAEEALLIYGDILSELKRWTAAEAVFRRLSESYEHHPATWYYWCRAFDQGDQTAARAHADERWLHILAAPKPDIKQLAAYSYFLHLDGQLELAKEYMKQAFITPADTVSLRYGGRWALLAALNKDDQQRQTAMTAALEHGDTFGRQLGKSHKKLLTWMNDQLSNNAPNNQPRAFTKKEQNSVLKFLSSRHQRRLDFELATYHEAAGFTAESIKYYKKLIANHPPYDVIALIARSRIMHLEH